MSEIETLQILSKLKFYYFIFSFILLSAILTILIPNELMVISKENLSNRIITKDKVANEIENLKNGNKKYLIYEVKHKKNKLITKLNKLSNSSIYIEELNKIILQNDYRVHKSKSNEIWLIYSEIEHGNKTTKVFNLSSLLMDIDKKNDYKFTLSNNDNNPNIIISDKDKNLILVQITENEQKVKSLAKKIFIISIIIALFLSAIYFFTKANVIVPFTSLISALMSINIDKPIPKKPIRKKDFSSLNKLIHSIYEKAKINKSNERFIDNFTDSFKQKWIKNPDSEIIYFSFKIEIDKPFSKIKEKVLNLLSNIKNIDIYYFDKICIISIYHPRHQGKDFNISTRNKIIELLNKIYGYKLSKNKVKYFAFNPYLIDSMEAFNIITDYVKNDFPRSNITLKGYKSFIGLKENIVESKMSRELLFKPILSKIKSINLTSVSISFFFGEDTIPASSYYSILNDDNAMVESLKSVIFELSELNKEINSLCKERIKFVVDFDFLFSHKNYLSILKRITCASGYNSQMIILSISSQYYSSDIHESLKELDVKIAINHSMNELNINLSYFDKISYFFVLAKSNELLEQIEMLSIYLKSKNVFVVAFDFNMEKMKELFSNESIDYLSSNSIRPFISKDSLISSIFERKKVISYKK